MLFFLISGAYKIFFTEFNIVFNHDSIPLLGVRAVLEILQAYFTLLAIKHCDRSTFSILRIITIPLLVMADILLWYHFSIYSFIWIGIILLSFLVGHTKTKTINWTWWYFALFTAVNAVVTLSLFKYSLTNYQNSIEVDQFFISFSILLFFLIYDFKKHAKCGLLLIIKEKQFLLQGIMIGLSSLLISYTYLYFNASEASSINRAGAMFWSIIAWAVFFQEKNTIKKLFFALSIIIGLFIMLL